MTLYLCCAGLASAVGRNNMLLDGIRMDLLSKPLFLLQNLLCFLDGVEICNVLSSIFQFTIVLTNVGRSQDQGDTRFPCDLVTTMEGHMHEQGPCTPVSHLSCLMRWVGFVTHFGQFHFRSHLSF